MEQVLSKPISNQHISQKTDNSLPEVAPWPDPVEPMLLLNEISCLVKRFIVCEQEVVTAATLWIAMTWFMDVIHVAPIAVITAPEKRCGKSQLLHLMSLMVCRPIPASNISPSALFRSIDQWQPTILIDEADAFMKDNEELRGIINAGHTRLSAYVIRSVGKDFITKRFNVWSAKAIAGIGKPTATIVDRGIILELRRKLAHESVDRLRHVDPTVFQIITAKLARFAQDYSERVRAARPDLPNTLGDRAQDNWEPLLAIASMAGNNWTKLAYNAANKISGNIDPSESIGVELLADIDTVISTVKSTYITTADLLAGLCKDPERPWATYNRGLQMTARQLANLLREFRIVSYTIRLPNVGTLKGYKFENFADAFARYIPGYGTLSETPSQDTNDGG